MAAGEVFSFGFLFRFLVIHVIIPALAMYRVESGREFSFCGYMFSLFVMEESVMFG